MSLNIVSKLYPLLGCRVSDSSFSIIKVFPGVEFSVIFQGDCEDVMLHVIAIFNDEDDEKIKNIKEELKSITDINRKKELMDMITNIKRGSEYNGK